MILCWRCGKPTNDLGECVQSGCPASPSWVPLLTSVDASRVELDMLRVLPSSVPPGGPGSGGPSRETKRARRRTRAARRANRRRGK